jgi:hypothetical protein
LERPAQPVPQPEDAILPQVSDFKRAIGELEAF